jgi:O-antigen/teichoic acid export membrane protein
VTATVDLPFVGRTALAEAERAALSVFVIRIMGAALAYGAQVLLARLLGKAEYGVFATVWVWTNVLGHGALWGLNHSACRFVPHYRARGETDLARGFLAGGAAFTVASGLATVAACGAILWLGRDWIGDAAIWPIAMALALVPLFALQDYVETVARSFNWAALAIAPTYILRNALIGTALVGSILLGAPAEAWVAVVCTLGALALGLTVQVTLVLRRMRRVLPPAPRRYRLREWVAATLPLAAVDLAHTGFNFVDVILLSFFLPPEAVAVYFAATRILQFVVFASYAASTATAPRFAEAKARGDVSSLKALVVRTARLTSAATILIGAAVLVAAPLLLHLFGPGFSASFAPLAVLVAGVVIYSAFGPAEDLLNMLGGERLSAAVALAALALAVCLNLLLIPRYGIMGAATAMAVAFALRGAGLAVVARARLGIATHILARGG